jgi:hypothetical protein
MPQVFKVGTYIVYFWINEGMPLEPIHVHVAEGKPVANGTKIWITEKGRALLANNAARIPQAKLTVPVLFSAVSHTHHTHLEQKSI